MWIAFNYWYLWYSEQLFEKPILNVKGCELLSIIGIFDILNNESASVPRAMRVVNCFQLLVSLIFWTTNLEGLRQRSKLWIAFNYWYLWYSEQPCNTLSSKPSRCELLSIIGIFDILNNIKRKLMLFVQLWIAFNYWYLWYSEQHQRLIQGDYARCELLSIIGIFDILNNTKRNQLRIILLWIAFNYWYLWYSEQPDGDNPLHRIRCELLSIIGIFDILNNPILLNSQATSVVNCFQLLVSLIFWTTTSLT